MGSQKNGLPLYLSKVPSIVRCFSFTLNNLSLDSCSNLLESSSIFISFSNFCCCFSFCIIAWVMLTNSYEQKQTRVNSTMAENARTRYDRAQNLVLARYDDYTMRWYSITIVVLREFELHVICIPVILF